jgi:hypothetical protein
VAVCGCVLVFVFSVMVFWPEIGCNQLLTPWPDPIQRVVFQRVLFRGVVFQRVVFQGLGIAGGHKREGVSC